MASLVFDRPFKNLFASVFSNREEDLSYFTDGLIAEEVNPFTELRLAEENSSPPAPPAADPPVASQETPPSTNPETNQQQNNPPQLVPGGAAPEARFTFLGDLDGTGVLRSVKVSQLNQTSFLFPEGPKTFNLFVNPSAIEHQRSFCIDDSNGDGLPDLLVTSRASLFGGVLVADGSGQFIVEDSFLTGYEPTVATLGAFRGSRREIVSLDTRTGGLSIFRHQERYRFFEAMTLDFLPDYIGQALELSSGAYHFIAAQEGGPRHSYSIKEEGVLELSGEEIPGEANFKSAQDARLDGARTVLQVFQIGSYASILLSNGHGQTFNVANLKVSPKVSLIIGDLDNDGAVDVAVATP